MTPNKLIRSASMALLFLIAAGHQLNAAETSARPAYPILKAMELAAPGPLRAAQDDGTICLNADAAAIIQWPGRNPYDGTPQLVNGNKGVLKVEDGHITIWNGYKERPFWRISVPKDVRYRVTITRSANVGRESTAWISIWKKDLAGSQAVKIDDSVTIDNQRLTLPGELIHREGCRVASPGDQSDPGLLLVVE